MADGLESFGADSTSMLSSLNDLFGQTEALLKSIEAHGLSVEDILQKTKLKNLVAFAEKAKKFQADLSDYQSILDSKQGNARLAAEEIIKERKKKNAAEFYHTETDHIETQAEREKKIFAEKVKRELELLEIRERAEDRIAERRKEQEQRLLRSLEILDENYRNNKIDAENAQIKASEDYRAKLYKKAREKAEKAAGHELQGEELEEFNRKFDKKTKKKAAKIAKGAKNLQDSADIRAESDDVVKKIHTSEAKWKAAFNGGEMTLGAKWDAIKSLAQDGNGNFSLGALGVNMVNGLASLAQKLDNKIDESGKHQTGIDTRLYGSTSNVELAGSYWRGLNSSIMGIAGASPLILQTEMIASLEKLVSSGISHNLKLRTFLDTVTDKIATTFEVNDNTMLRLIRIQQQDSTAARMGMESALNGFLNNMFETTEYLSKLADTVRGNLEEAQALMTTKQASEFEYQVQKWLGSFYSVGMSDGAVNTFSTVIGQLAAGDINALTSGGAGNLMIMAANQAGISIADILKDGLDADTTNKLLQATVNYLAQIAQQSESKVIQQQLAAVFGLKASDLKAVMNIAKDSKTFKNISNTNLTESNMLTELVMRATTMATRVSIGEMMTNVWENVQYTMASGIANNPAMYMLYKAAGLLEQAVGGIPISFLNVYGFGVNLETSVANIMRAGALAGGILSSIGSMGAALGNMVGGGAAMLMSAGYATQGKAIHRGNGAVGVNALAKSGSSTSSSGFVGNGAGGDALGAETAGADDDKKTQGQQGKEENEDATRDDIIDILKLLFGMLGKKIDENTEAVKSGGRSSGSGTMGGFTNAQTTMNGVI